MCSIIGRLASGHHRLGRLRGERAQPGALAAGHDDGLHGAEPTPLRRRPARPALAQRLASPMGTYVERGVVAEDAGPGTRDAPGQRAGDVVPADSVGVGPTRNSGNANIRAKVPALPNQ